MTDLTQIDVFSNIGEEFGINEERLTTGLKAALDIATNSIYTNSQLSDAGYALEAFGNLAKFDKGTGIDNSQLGDLANSIVDKLSINEEVAVRLNEARNAASNIFKINSLKYHDSLTTVNPEYPRPPLGPIGPVLPPPKNTGVVLPPIIDDIVINPLPRPPISSTYTFEELIESLTDLKQIDVVGNIKEEYLPEPGAGGELDFRGSAIETIKEDFLDGINSALAILNNDPSLNPYSEEFGHYPSVANRKAIYDIGNFLEIVHTVLKPETGFDNLRTDEFVDNLENAINIHGGANVERISNPGIPFKLDEELAEARSAAAFHFEELKEGDGTIIRY